MPWGPGFAELGEGIGQRIAQGRREDDLALAADQFLERAKELQIPDPLDPTKMVPAVSPKFVDAYSHYRAREKAANAAYIKGQVDLGEQFLKYKYEQQQRVPVQTPQGTFSVSPERALTASERTQETQANEPVQKAHARYYQAQATKAEQDLTATEAMVNVDLGGGNIVPLPAKTVISHPDLLKSSSAKQLNEEVFAQTGLALPQVSAGWNKRIVNGRLNFQAPIAQQKLDPITQKPIPVYDEKGRIQYETVDNPNFDPKQPEDLVKNPKVISRVGTYSLSKEHTPQVLSLLGGGDVAGIEQIKIPDKAEGPRVVPRAGGQSQTLQVGDIRQGYKYVGGDPGLKSSWEKQ